jgi:hypothetical protein
MLTDLWASSGVAVPRTRKATMRGNTDVVMSWGERQQANYPARFSAILNEIHDFKKSPASFKSLIINNIRSEFVTGIKNIKTC